MSVTENILEHLQSIPESMQREVLHFVEYLESKIKYSALEGEIDWATLSLSHAMRGLEEEPLLYSLEDVKDSLTSDSHKKQAVRLDCGLKVIGFLGSTDS